MLKLHAKKEERSETPGPTARERRRAKVRNSIIAAAESIFLKEGEVAVSMRRLAEETDYSPAALYKYFGSKSEVFEAVRESFFELLVDRIEVAMQADQSPIMICRRAAEVYIRTALENPGTYLMAFSTWGEHTHPEQGSFGHRAYQHLYNMLAAGIDAGEFHSSDISLTTRSTWASMHGLASLLIQVKELPQGIEGKDTYTREDIIAHHVDFLIGALHS